jgi:hypothetical protein
LPAVLIVAAVTGSARYHLINGLVRPSRDEHRIMLAYVKATFPERPETVTYVLSKWHFPLLSNGLSTAEFGKINSNNRTNARWFLEYVFDQAFADAPQTGSTKFAFTNKPPADGVVQGVLMNSTVILKDDHSGMPSGRRGRVMQGFKSEEWRDGRDLNPRPPA